MNEHILALAHNALVFHEKNVEEDRKVTLPVSRIGSEHFVALCELATSLGMNEELETILQSAFPVDLRVFLTKLTNNLQANVDKEIERQSNDLSSSLLSTLWRNGHMISEVDFENWYSTAFDDPFGDLNVCIGNEYQQISNTLDQLYLSVTTKHKALVQLPYSQDPLLHSVIHQWKSQGMDALVMTNGLEAMQLLDCYTTLLDFIGTRIVEADSSDHLWSIIQEEGFLDDYCIGGYSREEITEQYRPFVEDIWCECVNQLDNPTPTWLSHWFKKANQPVFGKALTLVTTHNPVHLALDNHYLFHVFSDEIDGELNTESQSRFILEPTVAVETLASVSVNRSLLGLALSLPKLLTRTA
ncbi:hypothetical protein ACPV5U_19570 [Vibrio mediterranei]